MTGLGFSAEESALIEILVAKYEEEKNKVEMFKDQLLLALAESVELQNHVHSMRTRLKDPDHLLRKLERKMTDSKQTGKAFAITPENLLTTINDLAGIRILHLHTRQIQIIDKLLREIFEDENYPLQEPPFARTWDDESRLFFDSCGIETQESPTLYTSVHYVVGSASRKIRTCEIQVRTLSEEVWGEVDHLINYPDPTDVLACSEQIKVLARVTSSATRLVDSIFLTYEEAKED